MLAPIHIGRDALVAVALVLQLFAEERVVSPGITISGIKAALPQGRIGKLRIDLPGGCDVRAVIEKWKQSIVKEYGDAVTLNEVDGLRVDHRDWWVHVRKSNTEPIVRDTPKKRLTRSARECSTNSRPCSKSPPKSYAYIRFLGAAPPTMRRRRKMYVFDFNHFHTNEIKHGHAAAIWGMQYR
jgi:hypothetical protein